MPFQESDIDSPAVHLVRAICTCRSGARFSALVSLRLQGHLVASAPVFSCLLEAQVFWGFSACLHSLRDHFLSCALCLVFAVGLHVVSGGPVTFLCSAGLLVLCDPVCLVHIYVSAVGRHHPWLRRMWMSGFHMFIAWFLRGLRLLLVCSDLGHDGNSALSIMHIAVLIGFRHCMFSWFVLGFGQIGLD